MLVGSVRGVSLAMKGASHVKRLPTTIGLCRLNGEEVSLSNNKDFDGVNAVIEGDHEKDLSLEYLRFRYWLLEMQMQDDAFVTRLRDAGDTIIGKRNVKMKDARCKFSSKRMSCFMAIYVVCGTKVQKKHQYSMAD